MYSIIIRASTKSVKRLMLNSPIVNAAKILHEHDLGELKEIHTKLMNLPASFGPIADEENAEHIVHLLVGAGVISEIREFNDK